MLKEMTGETPDVRSDKRKPGVTSISISLKQHLSASINNHHSSFLKLLSELTKVFGKPVDTKTFQVQFFKEMFRAMYCCLQSYLMQNSFPIYSEADFI